MRIDPVKNRVPGHRDPEEHLESVMEFIKEQMGEGAQVEIATVGDGVGNVVGFLDREWGVWGGRLAALGVGMGVKWRVGEGVGSEGFKGFWGKVSGGNCCFSFLLGVGWRLGKSYVLICDCGC